MNILRASASDLGRAIESGALDPVDVAEAFLEAIDEHPFSARIYTEVLRDRACSEALAARDRAKRGMRLGPLDGVPISWKDLFDSRGSATEAGSDLLAGRIPDRDAEVLYRASQGGAICLGKVHMSELAFSGLGLNPIKETPPCINDHDAVSGGSSSGSAASVAFGLAPLSIGSDTGGSVRIPAAWNDLVGLKTTSGRVSLQGVVPLCARFDTVGPLARSVEDAAYALSLIEGTRPMKLGKRSKLGIKLAVLGTSVLDGLEDRPKKAFEAAVERIKNAGIEVHVIKAPEVAKALDLSPVLFAPEAYGTWKEVIERAPEKMYPEILERFRGGASVSAAEYVSAWHRLDQLRDQYAARVSEFDAVLCPTAPILPPNAKRLLEDHDYYVSKNLLALRNTRVGNLMGGCSITLPTGYASCGLSLMGAPMHEERLLVLAHTIEGLFA